MHIGLLPRVHAARSPEKPAIRDPRRTVTWAGLEGRTNRLAQALLACGVRKRDLVGIAMGNRVEHLEAAFALAKAAAVGVPLDPAWKEEEFSRAVKFFGIQVFFAEHAAVANLVEGIEGLGPFQLVIAGDKDIEPFLRFEDLVQQGEDTPPLVSVSEQDPFMIMLTSGTTGTPKGCIVSHGAYLYRCLSYSVEFPMSPEEREIVALPLYLGAGRGTTFACLALGAGVILEPKFDPERFLDIVTREKVTSFSLVPTAFQALVDTVGSCLSFDGSSILSMKNVGSSIPSDLRRQVREQISPNLFQTYASVDTGIIAVLRPEEMGPDPAYVGRPIWWMEVKAVSEDGGDLPAGELGEIACWGPLLSQGYLRNPEADSAAFIGKWFKTGDIGCLDNEGHLFIRGRIKNLIKSGGRSVFPDEVEAVLIGHPDVAEATVLGIPDAKWGEAVHAVVVAAPGEVPSSEELAEFCRGRLASYKCPKQIHLMAELPRGNLGKVSIESLKRQIATPPIESTGTPNTPGPGRP